MIAPLAAILAALFFAASDYFSRVALERVSPTSAVLATTWVNVLVWWPLFIFLVPWRLLASPATLPFIAAGILGPFLARLSLYTGMQRLGVSVAAPISNTQVLVAALGGILFFSERITPLGGLGILVLVAGASLLRADPSAGNREGPRRQLDVVFPLLAALFFGVSYMFRKVGLQMVPELMLALPIISTTSLLTQYAAGLARRRLPAFPRGSVLWPLAVTGLLLCGAQLFSLWAIHLGDLAVVIPLQSTSPLFAVGITAVFLRRLERVTRLVWVGATLVVTGAVLVNL